MLILVDCIYGVVWCCTLLNLLPLLCVTKVTTTGEELGRLMNKSGLTRAMHTGNSSIKKSNTMDIISIPNSILSLLLSCDQPFEFYQHGVSAHDLPSFSFDLVRKLSFILIEQGFMLLGRGLELSECREQLVDFPCQDSLSKLAKMLRSSAMWEASFQSSKSDAHILVIFTEFTLLLLNHLDAII